MIIRKLYIIYIAGFFTDAHYIFIMLAIQEQAVSFLIRISHAISIKGQLIQNLIILHILLFLKDFILLIGIHLIHAGIFQMIIRTEYIFSICRLLDGSYL